MHELKDSRHTFINKWEHRIKELLPTAGGREESRTNALFLFCGLEALVINLQNENFFSLNFRIIYSTAYQYPVINFDSPT